MNQNSLCVRHKGQFPVHQSVECHQKQLTLLHFSMENSPAILNCCPAALSACASGPQIFIHREDNLGGSTTCVALQQPSHLVTNVGSVVRPI